MKRLAVTAVAVLGTVFIAQPARAQEGPKATDGPQELVVDKALAKTGKTLWSAKGCMGCHTIGKGKMAGPDLNGLLERRTHVWIKAWLHNPDSMFVADDTIKAMVKQYNNLKMPNLKLTDSEITALMHYIASENKVKVKK